MFQEINENLIITVPDGTDESPICIAVRHRACEDETWVLAPVTLEDLKELYDFVNFHFGIG